MMLLRGWIKHSKHSTSGRGNEPSTRSSQSMAEASTRHTAADQRTPQGLHQSKDVAWRQVAIGRAGEAEERRTLKMKRHKYALGLWEMLVLARHEHYKKHGSPPVRFEMHPATYAELRMDERMRYLVFDTDPPPFMGVPIAVDRLADRLKMITSDNTVEYL